MEVLKFARSVGYKAKAGIEKVQPKKKAADALKVMKAVLLVMVAVVSGVIVVGIAADLVLTWGVVILYLALQIAVGLAIGSLACAAAGKLVEMVWKPAFQM